MENVLGIFRTMIVFFVLLMLQGCGYSEQDMIQNSRGASYSQGYGDGCILGEKKAESPGIQTHQETQRYRTKIKYREGWDDGYKECLFRRSKVLERDRQAQNQITVSPEIKKGQIL